MSSRSSTNEPQVVQRASLHCTTPSAGTLKCTWICRATWRIWKSSNLRKFCKWNKHGMSSNARPLEMVWFTEESSEKIFNILIVTNTSYSGRDTQMCIQRGSIRDKDRVLNLLCFFIFGVAYHVLEFTKVSLKSHPLFDMCFRVLGQLRSCVFTSMSTFMCNIMDWLEWTITVSFANANEIYKVNYILAPKTASHPFRSPAFHSLKHRESTSSTNKVHGSRLVLEKTVWWPRSHSHLHSDLIG